MKTYEEYLAWAVLVAAQAVEDDNASIGDILPKVVGVFAASFIYGIEVYDIAQQIWQRVEQTYGDPCKGTWSF
jgi:hypothetical protein